jgi:hypothetical protein
MILKNMIVNEQMIHISASQVIGAAGVATIFKKSWRAVFCAHGEE